MSCFHPLTEVKSEMVAPSRRIASLMPSGAHATGLCFRFQLALICIFHSLDCFLGIGNRLPRYRIGTYNRQQ